MFVIIQATFSVLLDPTNVRCSKTYQCPKGEDLSQNLDATPSDYSK